MKNRCLVFALPLTLILTACGGGGPSAPGPIPSPTPMPASASVTISVTDGATDQELPGTPVTIAGRVYPAGVQATVKNGDFVDVQAQDFLSRQTIYRGESPQLTLPLWTNNSTLPANQTHALTYGSAQERLYRLTADRVAVIASDAFGESVEQAIDRLNQGTEGKVVFFRGTESSATPVKVRILVDPNDPALINQPNAAAVCVRQLDGYTIVGARIPVRSLELAKSPQLITHELGHAFGLWHNDRPGVMIADSELYNFDEFTAAEKLAMRLMLKRRPGNAWPDNDRSVTGQEVGRRESVVVCNFQK